MRAYPSKEKPAGRERGTLTSFARALWRLKEDPKFRRAGADLFRLAESLVCNNRIRFPNEEQRRFVDAAFLSRDAAHSISLTRCIGRSDLRAEPSYALYL
jgi:hypothetical protein